MEEITREAAIDRNLKFAGHTIGTNLSHTILIMERFKENKKIKYFSVDFIAVNEETHNGQMIISFWK